MAVRLMRLEYVKCRSWGHAWSTFIPELGSSARGASWGVRIALRCDRCSTERFDVIDARGELAARRYAYPDGYRMAADDRPDASQLRLDLVDRLKLKTKQRSAKRRRASR